jgi:hypothetical protein
MNAQELLNLNLDEGHSSLRDVFNSHLLEGMFSGNGGTDEEDELFFLQLAQKIIDAVKA